jgi:multicomponent Na+:H+ antiporter subunit F
VPDLSPLDLALGVLALTLVPAAWRAFSGPDDADRAVAADLVFYVFVAVVALLAVRLDAAYFFDVAVVAVLVGFLGSVALSRLVHRGGS